MPIYEYRCEHCHQLFQKLQPMSSGKDGVTCPSCGSRRIERQLSVFASGSQDSSAAPSGGCVPSGGG